MMLAPGWEAVADRIVTWAAALEADASLWLIYHRELCDGLG